LGGLQILTIYHWYTGVFSKYYNLSKLEKNKTIIIVFEKFIIDPNSYIDKICRALQTKRNKNFESTRFT
jgi:hypothetical protein